MSLIPAFEIGVWNAWILMSIVILHPLLMILTSKETLKRMGPAADPTKPDPFPRITWVLAFIYSLFLPLKLGTIWFYVGLPIYLLGLIMFTIAQVNFATAPFDEPVTKGIYRYSRHPFYLAQFLIPAGVGIASASWIFLLVSVVISIYALTQIIPEEHACLEKYGDAYRDYMDRTPRWIGIPKSGEK